MHGGLTRRAAASPGPVRLLFLAGGSLLLLMLALVGLQVHAIELAAGAMTGELSASEVPSPLLAELARSRSFALPIAALLPAVMGLAGTLVLAWARQRASALAPVWRWRRVRLLPAGSPAQIRWAARWPQAFLIVPLAAMTGASALLLVGADPVPAESAPAAYLLGAGLLMAGFPLLLTQRMLAALPADRLPEAASLCALVWLPMLLLPGAGLLEVAAAKGLPELAAWLNRALVLLPCAIAAELTARAAGRCFLPPPPADTARAAVNSLLARFLAEGAAARSLAAPVRNHLGIDFARSWALAFARNALAPMGLVLTLLAAGLSGVVLVPSDGRGVYERFGAPVRVLPPGLHLVLPWPLGRVRRVEFGSMHELALNGDVRAERFAAEDVPPTAADRLWEQESPSETWFLIASARGGQQSFQMVSADIRLFWRIGLDDEGALCAAYAAADPVAVLGQAARRGAAAFFAGRTLDAVLGENRETMAGQLRAAVQRGLDTAGVGIDLAAVVIEALHPPGGAADAYHAVQAAEIDAQASISAERGRAFARLSGQQQVATGMLRGAAASGAEIVGVARAEATRFAADRAADRDNRPPFRMEQRLAALRRLYSAGSITLLDHRIPPEGVAVLDLRPAAGAPVPPLGSAR